MSVARRRGALGAGLGALLAGFAGGGCRDEPPPATAREPRHLLVITIDTLRADRLGCYGNPRGLTPALDRIAREGTRFTRAVAHMPCTLPVHAALFTGLSPRASGVTSNFVRVPLALETLAERLQAAGFATTALFNQFEFAKLNLVQGFQSFENDPSEHAERIVAAFRAWLSAREAGARWFAWVHLFIPHGPLDVPERFLSAHVRHPYDGPLRDDFETLERIRRNEIPWPEEFAAHYRDRYDAAVACADARVEEILAAIEEARLLDETLLLCVADHGESLEHGVLGLHAPVLRDSTLRVPLLLRGPRVGAGRVVEAVVQHVDLFPTLLALLGLDVPAGIEGRNLRPLLAGSDTEGFDAAAVALLPAAWAGKRSGGLDPARAAVRRGRFELVLAPDGARELYDLEDDPSELRDLAGSRPDVVRALAAELERWLGADPAATEGEAVDGELWQQLRALGYQ